MPKGEKIVPLIEEKYYSDMRREGMLYAVAVRSPFSGGRFLSVSLEKLNEDEGEFFFSAEDIPGRNEVEVFNAAFPLLATGEFRYNGELLGVAVAKSEKRAKEIAASLLIELERDDVETRLKETIKNSFLTKEETGGFGWKKEAENEEIVVFEKFFSSPCSALKAREKEEKLEASEKNEENAMSFQKEGELPSAHEAIDETDEEEIKIDSSFSFEDVFYECGEKFGAFCVPSGDYVFIYAPVSWAQNVRENAARVTSLPEKNIIIKETRGAISAFLEEEAKLCALGAFSARKTSHPVKLVSDVFYSRKPRAAFSFKTRVSPSGKILYMKVRCTLYAGKDAPFSRELAYEASFPFLSLYAGDIKLHVRVLSTKEYPCSSATGNAACLSSVALEAHLNEIARKTGIYPDELREKNLREKHSPLKEMMKKMMDESDFSRNYASSLSMKSPENLFFSLPKRGFALSFAASRNFLPSSFPKYKVKVSARLSSDFLSIFSPFHGEREKKELKAAILDEMADFVEEDIKTECYESSTELVDAPKYLYRNFTVISMLLKRAISEIKSRRFKEPLPITSEKTASLYFPSNGEEGTGRAFLSTAYGCAAMEVILDSTKFSLKIEAVYMALHAGRIYDIHAAQNEVKLLIEKELFCLVDGEEVQCESINVSFSESREKPSSFQPLIPSLVRAAFLSAINSVSGKGIKMLPVKITEVFA